MIDNLPPGEWANIVTVIAAVGAAMVSNWTAIGQQTKQLKRAIALLKKMTHSDLEALRARVGAVEMKVDGMLSRRRDGDRKPPQSGGDPETGHLPPTPGGPNQS